MTGLSADEREAHIDHLYKLLCRDGWGDHYNCGGPDSADPMCGKEWAERSSIAAIFDKVYAPLMTRVLGSAAVGGREYGVRCCGEVWDFPVMTDEAAAVASIERHHGACESPEVVWRHPATEWTAAP